MIPNTDLGLRGLDLLDYTLKFIEAEPESWDQWLWISITKSQSHVCKTTACIAGWAAQFAGGQPCTMGRYDDTVVTTGYVVAEDGEEYSVREYAAEAMGLTESEQAALFKSDNTLADLKRVRDDVAERLEREGKGVII